MSKLLCRLIGAGVLGLIAAAVLADEPGPPRTVVRPFKIVFVDAIASDGERAWLKSRATRSKAAALRQDIQNDSFLVRKLQARGIRIKNIILRDRVPDGTIVFYVR